MRLRKRIKIAPGVNINLSKSGASVSVGKPGATVNVGSKGGVKATVGIPGSGLSHTEQLSKPGWKSENLVEPPQSKSLGFFGLLGYGVLALFLFLVLSGLFSG
ncbi:MAG: DUF4236 domain-containing protein [Nitrosomonadales bacterium]|nr:DUF4236 domain-containing protein [Nitrosomonadales bacterium]